MNVKYCDRCEVQMEVCCMRITYSANNKVIENGNVSCCLCEACANKFKEWLRHDIIIEGKLEKMVGDAE